MLYTKIDFRWIKPLHMKKKYLKTIDLKENHFMTLS